MLVILMLEELFKKNVFWFEHVSLCMWFITTSKLYVWKETEIVLDAEKERRKSIEKQVVSE